MSLSRREFIFTAFASVLSGKEESPFYKDVAIEVYFKARHYTPDVLRDSLLQWKDSLSKEAKFSKCDLEIALAHQGLLVVAVRCPASYYTNVDHWDLFPDPGHIRGKIMHPMNSLCIAFDRKYQNWMFENRKNLKIRQCEIRIRLRENK